MLVVLFLLLGWLLVPCLPARGADGDESRLTLEQLYSPDASVRVDFSGRVPDLEWLEGFAEGFAEGRLVERLPEPAQGSVWRVIEPRSGKASALYDAAAFARALQAVAGVSESEARSVAEGADLRFARDRHAAVFLFRDDLFYFRFGQDRVRRLTQGPEPELEPDLSPDGRMVSFARGGDLFVVEVDGGGERALTRGGSEELLHGHLDWVYQEEIYGRGNFRGYWWSPDSRFLAFLRLDESPVRRFTVVDHLPAELATEVTPYPKAGAPNPEVALGVVGAAGGAITWVDNSRYQPIEHLIVRVAWNGPRLVYQVQDREQTWLELDRADPWSGESTLLLREESPAFVNITGEPVWLADGSFLWLSERTGFQHLYHYSGAGQLLAQVTAGDWEVETLHGVDEAAAQVFYSGTEAGPTERHVYRVPLQGGERRRLTTSPGYHEATFAPDYRWFVDAWSDVRTPVRTTLHATRPDGAADSGAADLVRVIEPNEVKALAQLELGAVEFLQVPARDGFVMEAMVIKPPGFDPNRRYPVLQYNYGGPHSPVVKNRWVGARHLWHQLLAQHGYVVWACDNRSASGKGIAPTWQAYGRMGAVELQDIEDGVDWLKRQPWVDPGRIGIWGWSYGGFMAAYALTHSQSFRIGIAGAPVTDWRLYDTIYTERYMRRPQNNPEGYSETSVLEAAEKLHGKLLLVHGTMDDNVHFQNTVRLVYELQKAGKDFELMIYPKSRHGVIDQKLVYHLQRLMTDFVLENL